MQPHITGDCLIPGYEVDEEESWVCYLTDQQNLLFQYSPEVYTIHEGMLKHPMISGKPKNRHLYPISG